MIKYDDDKILIELEKLNGWEFKEDVIEKDFIFKNFKEAMTSMMRIGFEAEALNHHPIWTNVYNKLNIRLRTFIADGITERDFALARKIDELIDLKQEI